MYSYFYFLCISYVLTSLLLASLQTAEASVRHVGCQLLKWRGIHNGIHLVVVIRFADMPA